MHHAKPPSVGGSCFQSNPQSSQLDASLDESLSIKPASEPRLIPKIPKSHPVAHGSQVSTRQGPQSGCASRLMIRFGKKVATGLSPSSGKRTSESISHSLEAFSHGKSFYQYLSTCLSFFALFAQESGTRIAPGQFETHLNSIRAKATSTEEMIYS